MSSLTRTAATWWFAVRTANRGRLVYECVLALFCTLLTLLGSIAFGPEWPLPVQIAVTITATLATLVLIPLRLVRPVTAMALGSVVTVPGGGASVMLALLSFGTGYRAKNPVAITLGYLVAALCCFPGVMLQEDGRGVFGALLAVTLFACFCALPGAIGAMIAQRRLLVMTMHQRNLELHAERLLVAGQAQARERNRIAAELHDSLGHRLTLMSMYAGGLSGPSSSTVLEPAAREQAMGLLRDTSVQAMSELRQILKVLHQDDDGAPAGRSMDEVEPTVAAARRTGTSIGLERVGEPRPLGLMAGHAGFRVVQEGITNALKHAHGAAVRVEVRYEDDALLLEVRNGPAQNGSGPLSGQGSGQGLHGLAERVRLAGGVLSHGATDDGGFRLGAVLPYRAEVPGPGSTDGPGDFPQDIRRNSRRQKIGLVAVCASLLVALSSCVGAFAVTEYVEPLQANVFQSVQVGDERDRLRHLLPAEPLGVTTDPDGTRCETYEGDVADQDWDDFSTLTYRICYRDDVVVGKKKIQTEDTE
ncbi:hypothetical protein KIH74_11440 [Kineosporia sp. J2-2]|uniref:histidine kinase n=1 Tax=Kineosporia corallincola TaxID=2835133 RepID=A0ABS5TFB7_9ACTN|nr:histidine kinase [Kineosporia corallincola]MBT0769538.1 hypothetical protein [Kineosporia corallincola]